MSEDRRPSGSVGLARALSRLLFSTTFVVCLLAAPVAVAAGQRWGQSSWGTLLWGGGGAALPALGPREMWVLVGLLLAMGAFATRRTAWKMWKRRTGEER